MSLFEEPRKRADIRILYSARRWYWWCLQCDDIGGHVEDPHHLDPIIQCYRCRTRYGEVLDYPITERWTEIVYHYEYLPPLIFQIED